MFPIRDTIPSRHLPVAMASLIVANSLIFLLELQLPEEAVENFFREFGVVPALIMQPEQRPPDVGAGVYWTLLTSMFLHGGWIHIISNMWILYIFGDNVEDRMGIVRFMAFYLLCGVVSALVHIATNIHSEIPTVGASGAIAGVMGAYLLMFPHSRVLTLIPIFFWPFFVELPAVTYLGIWFVMQLLSGTAELGRAEPVAGIAFWAHIGGFLCGMAAYRWFIQSDGKDSWPMRKPRDAILIDRRGRW